MQNPAYRREVKQQSFLPGIVSPQVGDALLKVKSWQVGLFKTSTHYQQNPSGLI